MSAWKRHICEKDYIRNTATCGFENGKYLTSILDDSAITCDEVIESYAEETLMEIKQYLKCKIYIFYIHFYWLPLHYW